MQVPRRKFEKYTNLQVDPHVTQEKFDELSLKLSRMKKSRPALAAEVHRLAANGDFSENAEYQIAKGKLRGLNQRILDIEDHLRKAVIIVPKVSDVVAIGSSVTISSDGKEKTFQILGSSETKPEKGIISYQSPLGKALINKRKGETASISIGKRDVVYTILHIT